MITRWPTRELKMWSYSMGRVVPSDRWTNRLQVPDDDDDDGDDEHDVLYEHQITKDIK